MAAVILAALLGLAAGAELQLSGEVDVVTSSLYVVEMPPAAVVKAPGHLRQCAKMLPPSVTLAAAIWAYLSKARLENLAVELGEEAAEVVEQLHLPQHEPEEPVPETSSALRRWAAPLALLAFGLVALRRRRGKAKAQDVQELPLAEGEPVVKRRGVQMFRISTEQPDEEPEPAHWKRMMSNLSDMSDRPLELGNSTEVFRMQTQEILSSASQSADAGEGSSDKPPQLSSSSSSSPSRNVLQEEAEQEEIEAEAEKAELAKAEQEAQAEKELQKEPQKEQEAPAQAEQAEQAEQEQETAPEEELGKPSTPAEPESSEPTASASQAPTTAPPEPSEPSEPSSAADFLVSVPPEEERKPLQDRPRESKSSSITPPVPIRGESPQENDAVRKVVTKTPTQFPTLDTPRRRGLNSSLIGAPADKIREIASHLTSGQPPVYSPAASSPTSPTKKSKPEKASKA